MACELTRNRRGALVAGLASTAVALSLAGCTEVETETATGYEPAKLTEVAGGGDIKLVTFTPEGAARTGLKMGEVSRSSGATLVPYEAVIYDAEGNTFVYRARGRLSYLRTPVKIARIDGERVRITEGPPAGTKVVTVGAVEVYGTELDIAGSH